MKAKALLLCLTVAALSMAAQDTVKFARTYKDGEKDVYKMNIKTAMAMGEIDISMQLVNTIKKVYENGDADQETLVSGMKLAMNGNEMPMPGAQDQKPVVMRINKYGAPADPKVAKSASGMAGRMDQLMNITQKMLDREFKIGEVINIDEKDGKAHVTGTLKLDSIVEGVAKLVSDIKVVTEGAEKPMKVSTTSWIEVASAKPNKMEGTVLGVPAQQGMEIDTVKFVMERVK